MYRLLITLVLLFPATLAANPWAGFDTPLNDEPEPVGGYSNGCLIGGKELDPDGTGYQVVRLSRKRNFGHPELVRYLEDLGRKIKKNDLGLMLVADMAMPRGGPFTKGHVSHQTGLDADIWLPLDYERIQGNRDDLESITMVDHDHFAVDTRYWGKNQAEMIRLAAEDDRVARIFVHPAIKKALCETDWSDRGWLNRIRPWWRHDSHFHVRLHCPPGAINCKPQTPPPAGDGCGADLASWYPENQPDKPVKKTPRIRPPLPAACRILVKNNQK